MEFTPEPSYPEQKTYDEMVPVRVGALNSSLIYPKAFVLASGATLTPLGTVQIDGHRCLKIEVLQKDKTEKIYLYSRLDLKNLVIVDQELETKQSTIQRLNNTSLEASDALVEIPAGFKAIEHDTWARVESAKVTYKGKPSRDFGVFRAPEASYSSG